MRKARGGGGGRSFRTIRRDLTKRLLLGLLLLVAATGLVFYISLRSMIVREFNDSLKSKAQLLATLVLQFPNRGIDFDFTDEMMPEFQRRRHGETEYFQIWFAGGIELARSASLGRESLPRYENFKISQAAIRDITLPDGRPGRAIGFGFTPQTDFDPTESPNIGIPKGVTPVKSFYVYLTMARGREPLDRTLRILQAGFLGVAVLLPLASALLVWVLVRRGLKPLDHLAEEVAGIDSAQLGHRLDSTRFPGELQPVASTLNSLLARLEAAFQRERRYTSDVAHELRTPIAELRSLTEVALIDTADSPLIETSVREAHDISRQMEKLVTTLLTLARSEAGQQSIIQDQIDLNELLHSAWAALAADTATRRHMEIEWNLEPVAAVEADRVLLGRILRNLLGNAVAHGSEGGTVRVTNAATDRCVRLRIANATDTLAREDLQHLFDPFWRKDTSRSDAAHSGLGLALVQALCRLMQIRIEAKLNDKEFAIELFFPIQPPAADAEAAAKGGVNLPSAYAAAGRQAVNSGGDSFSSPAAQAAP